MKTPRRDPEPLLWTVLETIGSMAQDDANDEDDVGFEDGR